MTIDPGQFTDVSSGQSYMSTGQSDVNRQNSSCSFILLLVDSFWIMAFHRRFLTIKGVQHLGSVCE